MTAARLVLGAALLAASVAMIARSRALAAHARRRRSPAAVPALVWLFVGTLLAINGVLQLVVALA